MNEATLATLPDVHRPASLARLQRLGNITVNQLGAVGVDIEIEARPDGRVAVIMAPEWGSLLLANLEAQAVAFKEKLQRSAFELQRRSAEQRAASEEAARRWEQGKTRIYRRGEVLVARGLSRWDAIRQITKESCGALPAAVIQTIVEGASPEKRQQRRERHERIQRKAQHLTPSEIALQEGVSINTVYYILRGGSPKKIHPKRSYTQAELRQIREHREIILALHAKGRSRKEIAVALGVELQKVYDCLKNARIRLRPEHRERNARIWEKAKKMTIEQIAAEESLTVEQVRDRLRRERRKHDGKTDSGPVG